MKCTNCREELCDDELFCHRCGAKAVRELFCPNCGKKLREGAVFCSACGTKCGDERANADTAARVAVPEQPCAAPPPKPSTDKWAWMLAAVPLGAFILIVLLGANIFVAAGLAAILNYVFYFIDKKGLESEDGVPPGDWVYLGLILIPLYLFFRASKVKTGYGYAIVWCVLFAAAIAIGAIAAEAL